jgi:hypothetical protein
MFINQCKGCNTVFSPIGDISAIEMTQFQDVSLERKFQQALPLLEGWESYTFRAASPS